MSDTPIEEKKVSASPSGEDVSLDDDEPSQNITITLITKALGVSPETAESALSKAKTLHLEWMRVKAIDNLEIVHQIQELYLQHVSKDVLWNSPSASC